METKIGNEISGIVQNEPAPISVTVDVNGLETKIDDEITGIVKNESAPIVKHKPTLPGKSSLLSVSLDEIINTIIKKVNEIIVENKKEPMLISGVEKKFEGDESKCVNYRFPFPIDDKSKIIQKGGTDDEDKIISIKLYFGGDYLYKNIALILIYTNSGKIKLFNKKKNILKEKEYDLTNKDDKVSFQHINEKIKEFIRILKNDKVQLMKI